MTLDPNEGEELNLAPPGGDAKAKRIEVEVLFRASLGSLPLELWRLDES